VANPWRCCSRAPRVLEHAGIQGDERAERLREHCAGRRLATAMDGIRSFDLGGCGFYLESSTRSLRPECAIAEKCRSGTDARLEAPRRERPRIGVYGGGIGNVVMRWRDWP